MYYDLYADRDVNKNKQKYQRIEDASHKSKPVHHYNFACSSKNVKTLQY